jgi:carboxypeptidase Taq
MYAAQLFTTARKSLGDLDAQFAKGDFLPLREWLREHVHRLGRQYLPGQLIERITGKPLSHEPLVEHLKAKFGPLYGL